MIETVGRFLALILASVCLFVVPLVDLSNSHDDMMQTYVYEQTNEYVDLVCTHARITQGGYLNFVQTLDATGNIYDVRITAGHSTVIPMYGTNSSGEVVVTGTRTVDEYTYEDEILDKLFQTDGYFELKKGDTISFTITSRNQTVAQQIRSSLLGIADYGYRIMVTAGGVVRDENF